MSVLTLCNAAASLQQFMVTQDTSGSATLSINSMGDLNGTVTIANVTNVSKMRVGMSISGYGIPFGTTITAIVGTTLMISQPATQSLLQSSFVVQNWTAVAGYANVPCSIQPAGASERYKYQQRNLIVSHAVYFPQPLPITTKHRLVDTNGNVYRIHGYGDAAGRHMCFVVDCELTLQ